MVSIANHHETNLTAQWSVSILCMVAKFICTVGFYIHSLQAMELFPTCVRSTGLGFSAFVAGLFSLGGPHITGLGSKDKRIPLGAMGLINLVAAVSSSFLPETVGCALPETLQAASDYGQNHDYFSYIKDGKIYNFLSKSTTSTTHNK